jgi:hypothetical protein
LGLYDVIGTTRRDLRSRGVSFQPRVIPTHGRRATFADAASPTNYW